MDVSTKTSQHFGKTKLFKNQKSPKYRNFIDISSKFPTHFRKKILHPYIFFKGLKKRNFEGKNIKI